VGVPFALPEQHHVISTDDLVIHMRGVQAAERDLRDLGIVWRMIESSAAISCPQEVEPILPTLVNTRERFDALRLRLVTQMVQETQAELADELAAKSQCAIDILVRNLYERTADVGFLATDDVVRAFCADPSQAAFGTISARLAEYQAKYSVYDDVILLSPSGTLLARLDTDDPLPGSRDPIVAEAIAADGHVERFRRTDLAPGAAPALLYAHRILSADGRRLGVLVLRFRFADEMQRIFSGINEDNAQLALVLVDASQRVVATNDEAHVPTGALMAPLEGAGIQLTAFAGREYLAICRASHGYQGYSGPAWRAQAMVSLLTAFRQRPGGTADGEAVPLDNAELMAMNVNADTINRDLRRVVWNGRLMASEQGGDRARLKAVLKQVNTTGILTRERVAQAIHDIYRTSLARAQRQTRELARLAADIMDRNLYERANDCRWWALSPVLRAGMSEDASAAQVAAMAPTLDHINGLYTVYSRLVAFDMQGSVRAASRAAGLDGSAQPTVPVSWVRALDALGDSQRYAVSPFEDTTLHEHGPTYVYLAAVRSAAEGRRTVGGIAVVFNAAAELRAMLGDVMADRAGVAAFVDAHGRVLAATDTPLAQGLASLAGSAEGDALGDHDGAHYACARARSRGYREFKHGDGYDNGVHAMVALRLGTTERRRTHLRDADLAPSLTIRGGRPLELAVFQVGGHRFALAACEVLEALPSHGVVRTPGATPAQIGMVEVGLGPGSRLVPVLCARRLFGVDYPARASDGVLLVVRSVRDPDRPAYALRVDDVLTVMDVPRESVHPSPEGFSGFVPAVSGLVDCRAGTGADANAVLVQLLSAAHLASVAVPGQDMVADTALLA